MVEDREKELSVEMSQNGEVQRSRGGRVVWAAPGGPGPVIWLASWHSPAKNPKIRQGKSQSIPPQRVIYIFIYIIYYQPKLSGGRDIS